MEDEVKEVINKKGSNKKTEVEPLKPQEPELENIGLDTFIALEQLNWQAKSRLEHYLTVNKLPGERTLAEWQKILATL